MTRNVELPTEFNEFATAVLNRASGELQQLDPEYVAKLRDVASAGRLGLFHPDFDGDRLPRPRVELPRVWTETLEAVFDLANAFDMLFIALHNLKEAGTEFDRQLRGRKLSYHGACWNIWAQALSEKAIVAITRATRRSGLNQEDKRRLIEARCALLRKTQTALEAVRDPLVHGGPGTIMSAATQDHLWEPMVVIGMTPDKGLPHLHNAVHDRAELWHSVLTLRTNDLHAAIAKALEGLPNAIGFSSGR